MSSNASEPGDSEGKLLDFLLLCFLPCLFSAVVSLCKWCEYLPAQYTCFLKESSWLNLLHLGSVLAWKETSVRSFCTTLAIVIQHFMISKEGDILLSCGQVYLSKVLTQIMIKFCGSIFSADVHSMVMFGCSWFIIFLVVCCKFGLQIAIWFLFMLTLCLSNSTRKGSKQEVRW